jgi:hypothetical protein
MEIISSGSSLIKNHPSDQNKHQNQGEQYQEPRKCRGTRTTNQIQYPRPKKNVNDFEYENHSSIRYVTRVHTNTVNLVIRRIIILNRHDKNEKRGNDKIHVRGRAPVSQSLNSHPIIVLCINNTKNLFVCVITWTRRHLENV